MFEFREIWKEHFEAILQTDEGNKVKQMMKMEVRVSRAKGRPIMRWMDNIGHEQLRFGGGSHPGKDGGRWIIIAEIPFMAH